MEHGKPYSTTDGPLVDFDAVCQKVRAAVEPARAHAVSLHDELGDVLWLSESSMGPDEHNAVREAVEAFSNPSGPPVLVHDLGDSRSALLLRAVNARRAMVGVIMMIMDARVIKPDARGALKVMTPKLQRALVDFATMRPETEPSSPPSPPARVAPARTPPARTPPAGELSLVEEVRTPPPAAAPRAVPPPPPRAVSPPAPPRAAMNGKASAAAPVARAAPAAVPTTPPAAAPRAPASRQQDVITPEIDRLHAALRRSPIALHVQRLMPLTKGSQLRRYEVLLRSKSDAAPNAAPQAMLKAAVENGLGSMIDRRVVTELIGFLVHHPDVWKSTAVMFSVNLTTTAVHDEHFLKFVELCLEKSGLPKGMIAFEVDTATAVKLADKMPEVGTTLHRLGCPLILDDFALKTECFALLRLPGVHYVKLAPEITAKMRTDKLSQAAITAVVQMARVLGMHTVAKRTENAAEQEWLTALGVDFIQSNSMSPPVAIESLSKMAQAPKAPI
ncbi:MAG TPA: EAL domain-containing protein [Steroidobacteraceae bacterium]|jgi:EAL domain-containing protein (putative c-di-GMP-specific phosphodiesterase class I)|nr:EAL domain-containing protein [Steroidobacteraceae bacterium]